MDISESNKNLLDSLIKTTAAIKKIYDRLYELEISNKKRTNEYQKLLEYLKIAIDVENKEYLNSNINYEEALDIVDYITYHVDIDDSETNFDTIVEINDDDLIHRRIVNKLYDKCIINSVDDFYDDTIEELLDDLNISGLMAILKKSPYTCDMFFENFNNNLYDGFLYFLRKVLNSNEFDKKPYHKAKYIACFLLGNVEKNMINNSFDIPNIVVQPSLGFDETRSKEAILYGALKERYAFNFSIQQIGNLLRIDDIDYIDKKMKPSSVLKQCFIKSSFLLMSDDAINNIKDAYYDLINDDEHESFKASRYISRQMVDNCFINYQKEKEACIIK